jgi:hypothetical protein
MNIENFEGFLATPAETSRITKIPVKTLNKWRWEKKGLPYIKLGNARKSLVRYRLTDITAYLEQATVKPQ